MGCRSFALRPFILYLDRVMKQEKIALKGMSLEELQEFVESLGEKKFRAAQLFSWMYAKGAQTFDEMTDISLEFRKVLSATVSLGNIEVVRTSVSSSDGTTKFLFRLEDGLMVESVLIPAEDPERLPEEESEELAQGPDTRLTL